MTEGLIHPTFPMSKVGAIIVAAGSGERLGAGLPKALVEINGLSLVAHAVIDLWVNQIAHLVVVAPPDGVEAMRDSIDTDRYPVTVVPGGPTRQSSVQAGLDALDPAAEWVLVHDAARPLATADLAGDVVEALYLGHSAVVPGVPITDTVKQVADGVVVRTIDRSNLVGVQTPQGFRRDVLVRAHAEAPPGATDDAGMVEALGIRVHVIPGAVEAMKVTTAHDLKVARLLAGPPPGAVPVIGTGVDIHAWATDDRPLWLAGLHWPGETGLAGHSDADVAAHAACNALLSAAGMGDLGAQFGTDQPEWAGAGGLVLLAETAMRVRDAGFWIGNISVQIIGPRPKLGPRRDEAQDAMSEAAGATVTIGAATSDGLGFTGRGEGLAAMATALLLPRP